MVEQFLKYLEEAVGHDNAAVFSYALGRPPSVSVRFNPAKVGCESVGKIVLGTEETSVGSLFGCGAEGVPWSPCGYLLDRRPDFTLDPLFHCGAYYVQDSSAMFVGEVFRRVLDDFPAVSSDCGDGVGCRIRILDLCAAPGGKTTDLASSLRERFGDSFLLVANEVASDRAGVLSENVARWGDPCVMVTSAEPAAFSALPGFFDIILADVPCSGEGMFRKDANAVSQWSESNVSMCAGRQRRIVADVWPALKEGGTFVYSTCTFNKYENDGNVEWMLGSLGCGRLDVRSGSVPGWEVIRTAHGFCLVPGLVPGEGQFCAAVRKTEGLYSKSMTKNVDFTFQKNNFAAKIPKGGGLPDLKIRIGGYFNSPVDLRYNARTQTVIAVPQSVVAEADTVRGAVRVLRSGCAAGTVKGKDIVPSADLALSTMFRPDAFAGVEVDLDTALAFLHGDCICLPDAGKGYQTLLYKSMPLGFVKNLGTRCNNLHPAGRRIRMDIQKR